MSKPREFVSAPRQFDSKKDPGLGSLRNYWHPVAESQEVVEQPRPIRLLDEDLVVFRDDEGVVVFKDLCIHRGTALSLGSVTEEGFVRCGYHGWEYDRTGACRRIPALPPDKPIPKSAQAIAYRAVERYNLVWVAVDEPISPIPEFPRNELDDPSCHSLPLRPVTWNASAGRVIENFLDFSHFPFVHEGLLGDPDRAQVAPYEVIKTDEGLHFYYEQEEPSVYSEGDTVKNEYFYWLPFTAFMKKIKSNGEFILIAHFTSPVSSNVTTKFLKVVRNYALDADDSPFLEFHTTVMNQDRVIVESQRPEEIPTDLKEELHIKVPDAAGIALRRILGEIT